MSERDDRLLEGMLVEQSHESAAEPSPTIVRAITSRPPEWLYGYGLPLLDSASSEERILGARLLRELPEAWADTVAADLLRRLLAEPMPDVIAAYLHAFAFVGRPAALTTVLSYVDHPTSAVRDAVADAISACSGGELGTTSRQALLTLAGDHDVEVRFSAVFELGAWWEDGFRGSDIEGALRRAAEDPDPLVSDAAVAALGDDHLDA